MKVLIPVVDHENAKNKITKEFDDAASYCIYDSLNKTYEWLPTNALTSKIGNISFALKRKGILSVIIREMPIMAIHLFSEMGIALYSAQGNNLDENIKLFDKEELSPLTIVNGNVTQIHVSNCSTSCGSCNSGC
ncbi:MAG: NifB/NifX family molybdenum-iron cluster-binding protein [Marinifilaceae bacterium]|nr:NifB/NifX family molybdenum-iron cluster-binding protein [Marinifilaceae bacterium]